MLRYKGVCTDGVDGAWLEIPYLAKCGKNDDDDDEKRDVDLVVLKTTLPRGSFPSQALQSPIQHWHPSAVGFLAHECPQELSRAYTFWFKKCDILYHHVSCSYHAWAVKSHLIPFTVPAWNTFLYPRHLGVEVDIIINTSTNIQTVDKKLTLAASQSLADWLAGWLMEQQEEEAIKAQMVV